jgi:hypothetical protein
MGSIISKFSRMLPFYFYFFALSLSLALTIREDGRKKMNILDLLVSIVKFTSLSFVIH